MKSIILTIITVLFISCKLNHVAKKSSVSNSYSNHNSVHTYLLSNQNDSVYVNVFQGININGETYLSWSYRSTADSIAFIVEKASVDMNFKAVYIKNKTIKPANVFLTECYKDKQATSTFSQLYLLKVVSTKLINPIHKELLNHSASATIKVETNQKNVPYSLISNP